MPTIIGVKYNKTSSTYYFDPNGIDFEVGDYVLIESDSIIDIAKVVQANKEISDSEIKSELKKIKAKANKKDLEQRVKNDEDKDEIIAKCEEKAKKHNLEMKILDVHRSFDRKKITIYFSADGRVDFRNLVKDLAFDYHARIELRQIYEKDQIKMIGSLGPCGNVCCCNVFLKEPLKASLKMAKNQDIALNPAKISGMCGKLMCCLSYENETYENVLKMLPSKGTTVIVEEGEGLVIAAHPLTEIIDIRIEKDDNVELVSHHVSEVQIKEYKQNK